MKKFISLLCIFSILPGSLFSTTAFAGKDPYTSLGDPKHPPKGATADINVEDLCNKLIQKNGDKWEQKFGSDDAAANDQWCSDHGNPTNDMIVPGPNAAQPKKQCGPFAVLSGSDFTTPDPSMSDCNRARDKNLQCTFNGGQLITQCAAYMAAEQAGILDWTMLAVDIGVTAVCTTECLATMVGGVTVAAAALPIDICGGAALVAGGIEFEETIRQKSSPVSSMIDGLGAAAGGVTLVAGATQKGHDLSQTTAKVASCVTAGLFAIMTGIRVNNIADIDGVKKKAADAIKDLASVAPNTDGSGDGKNDPRSGGFNPTGASTGGFGPEGAGGKTDSGVTTTSQSDLAKCAADPVCAKKLEDGVKKSGATDADIFNKTGATRLVAPIVANTDFAGLKKQIAAGGAGGAVGSALGASAGDLGAKVAEIAQAGQDHARDFGGGFGGSGYSGGGGGGGSKGSEASSNPFANLFGAKDGGAATGGGGSAQFGRAPSADIWHTGTHMNLFEIVSDKVSKVVSRVNAKN